VSSFRRLISSRANAALSTGPRTEAGKRRSSQNALRHGFRSRCAVILESESPQEFDALRQRFLSYFQPRSPLEHACVIQMAIARWHQRRLSALETKMWNDALAAQTTGAPPTRTLAAFLALCATPGFAALSRYEATCHQSFARALRLLLNLSRIRPLSSALVQPASPAVCHNADEFYTNEANLRFPDIRGPANCRHLWTPTTSPRSRYSLKSTGPGS
jgi:hypothetical protein